MSSKADYAKLIATGDTKALARCISFIENEVPGYEDILLSLSHSRTPVMGITGPPGAGKSTLTDALLQEMTAAGKKVAVLCVDPSSPFNMGAILGDRIRMSRWYNHPGIFIRSLASRGALGGLHPKIIEITDLMKSAPFDYVLVETVGVGQSEIEIAGLADTTIVVLVPEAGDEIQTMKAGLMEIADIFVVNKADRPGADVFVKSLKLIQPPEQQQKTPIVKTIASTHIGIDILYAEIEKYLPDRKTKEKKYHLLTEKAWQLIQHKRMQDLDKSQLMKTIIEAEGRGDFNLYKLVGNY